jgi:hypothetical protein
VHLVLTAHPTEARRELHEQIDLLWRTSQLRVEAMDPIDEVRTVMTAFDETLFRVVPAVYRELDRAVAARPAQQFTRQREHYGLCVVDPGLAVNKGAYRAPDQPPNPFSPRSSGSNRRSRPTQCPTSLKHRQHVHPRTGATPSRTDAPAPWGRSAGRRSRRLR